MRTRSRRGFIDAASVLTSLRSDLVYSLMSGYKFLVGREMSFLGSIFLRYYLEFF
jgi:hypothetical protein